jgi:hypothetical protein
MSTVYSRRNLTWVRDGSAWVVRNGRLELARVVPDEKHPGMWRVRCADGRLSDMANITWAKDAAATMALAVLNRSVMQEPMAGTAHRRKIQIRSPGALRTGARPGAGAVSPFADHLFGQPEMEEQPPKVGERQRHRH